MNFDNLSAGSRVNPGEVLSGLNLPVKPETLKHLRAVYSLLMLTLLTSAISTVLCIQMGLRINYFITLIGVMGCSYAIKSTPNTAQNFQARAGYLLGIGVIMGLTYGPLVQVTRYIDPSLPITAFIASAAIFGCFSVSALYANTSKSFLLMGGFLSSCALILSICGIANAFIFGSATFDFLYLVGGLLVMCGYVGYDTQKLIFLHERGHKDIVGSAFEFFIDFVGIFVRVLILLAKMNSKRSSNDRRGKSGTNNRSTAGSTSRR